MIVNKAGDRRQSATEDILWHVGRMPRGSAHHKDPRRAYTHLTKNVHQLVNDIENEYLYDGFPFSPLSGAS